MDYHIWDYRTLPGSMWNDQINVIFMLIWYILVAIIIPVPDYIDWKLFNYKKDTSPYYVVFGKRESESSLEFLYRISSSLLNARISHR